jgi:hypothetical protein
VLGAVGPFSNRLVRRAFSEARYRDILCGIMTSDELSNAVRVPIGFPPALYDWLRMTAFRRRVPMAVVVREALTEYRERVEPQLSLSLPENDEPSGHRPQK